jgi:hypothetical protein
MMAARKKRRVATEEKVMRVAVFNKKRKLVKVRKARLLPDLPANLELLRCCWDLNQFLVQTSQWMDSVYNALWGPVEEVPPPPPKWPPK